MHYITAINQSLRKWAEHSHSSPIIISAVRDLTIIAETQLTSQIMQKTALIDKKEPNSFEDIMNGLKETDRDLQSILQNIEYLQQNISQPKPSEESDYETAEKTAIRLAQLRNEAVVLQDFQLAYEIETLFENIGLS